MTGERWQQIETVFAQVADCPLPQRQAYLDRLCQGDDELRREVESLLACDEPDERLVDIPTTFLDGIRQQPGFGPDLSGKRAGAYRLMRLIGHGGMGAVYLGVRDDDQFRKQVAIKLLKRGMDTEFMLSRFRQERQILANLEHPFIARLLDGGATEDGLPYFVMEYVDGVPITKYCDDHGLSIPERLRLFRLVCEAVQYAHQNLVVHRDIKPSNILTTKEGVPKLLDFGIAKALDPGLRSSITHTQREFRMLTPDYASPEQVRGVQISTASDTYSLGAVLYELLSGRRPHQFPSDSLTDMEKVICETEPEKPSIVAGRNMQLDAQLRNQLKRQISGDLDNIVLTAMRLEPQRRYASAAEFSEDLRRHLEGLPVLAREDRWSYRAGKFVRRNKLAAGAALVLAATLVGGIVATTVQARRAERRFQLVRDLAHSNLFDLYDQMERLPGSTALRASTVRTVVQYLDALAQEGNPDPQLGLEIAEAYERAAALEGHPFESNLGDTSGALAHYRKALALYERTPDRPELRLRVFRGLIDCHLKLAQLESLLGSPDRAAFHSQKASGISNLLDVSGVDITPSTRINIYMRLADSEYDHGSASGEIRYFTRAIDTAEKWFAAANSADSLSSIRDAYRSLGSAFGRAGDLAAALESQRKAKQLDDELIKRNDIKQDQRYNAINIHMSIGDVMGAPDDPNLGDHAGAVANFEAALDLASRLAEADPTNVYARRSVATCYQRLGMVWESENPARALDYYAKSVQIAQELNSADPRNAEYRYHASRAYMGMGIAQHNLGRHADAVASLDHAIELQKAIAAVSPERIWNLRALTRTYRFMGAAQIAGGESAKGLASLQEALTVADTMLARAPNSLPHQLDRADAMEALAHYYLEAAKSPATPAAERAGLRATARSCLEQSQAIFHNWTKAKLAEPYATRRETSVASALATLPQSR